MLNSGEQRRIVLRDNTSEWIVYETLRRTQVNKHELYQKSTVFRK